MLGIVIISAFKNPVSKLNNNLCYSLHSYIIKSHAIANKMKINEVYANVEYTIPTYCQSSGGSKGYVFNHLWFSHITCCIKLDWNQLNYSKVVNVASLIYTVTIRHP